VVSGRTLGQRATKVRVNNEGEHIRLGGPADPYASTGSLGSKQSTLSFSKRADVPAFQHNAQAAARPGDISYSSDFSGHSVGDSFFIAQANRSLAAASSGQPQTFGHPK
jgi:hypothetical protein